MATDSTTGNGANGGVSSFAFPRYEQTFPELTPHEIVRMRRFGELRTYQSGETLFETGKVGPGMFVILSGHVTITQRDGLGNAEDLQGFSARHADHGSGDDQCGPAGVHKGMKVILSRGGSEAGAERGYQRDLENPVVPASAPGPIRRGLSILQRRQTPPFSR